jgi:hypothetical protein
LGEPLISTTRQGTKDTGSEDTGKFPFEAFEFTLPSGSAPVLTLRSPWTLIAGVTGNVTGDVTGFASENAPLPQTAAGVGQFLAQVSTGSGNASILPAGGTWLWWIQGYSNVTGGLNYAPTSGISAGGTTIAGGVAGINWDGWIWRIT